MSSTEVSPQQQHSIDPALSLPEGQHLAEKHKKKPAIPRLKKACDACSKRKIKCDEAGPPCHHCREVGIPCTFARQSRRRGPRNRHADAIKEQLAIGITGDVPASPTYAAQTLASLAQQPVLSTDTICPFALLERLVDDYFTYIHPLIPVPHEPSFRAALAARADMNNPAFLALLASMIGCLVASFPRRPRLHIQNLRMEALIPNSSVLLERCRRTTVEARGIAYLDRQQTIDDVIVAYLQGLIAAYSFNWDACRLYLGQCVTISRVIGLHRQDGPGSASNAGMNGDDGIGSHQGGDIVLQETSRRMFWSLYSTVTAFQQLGLPLRELSMPPPTPAEPYPDLPMEVDDVYIISQGVRPVPPGELSTLAGFNAMMKIYKACADVTAMELAYGTNELFDWARQRQVLQEAINKTKDAMDGLASELLSTHASSPASRSQPQQDYPLPNQGYPSLNGGHAPIQTESERKHIQFEIQKMNLAAAEVAIRSFLVEKYSILSDKVHNPSRPVHDFSDGQNDVDEMREEREAVIKDFSKLIRDLDLTYLEASGLGFTNKIRQTVSTLVNMPPHRKSELHRRIEQDLLRLVDFLGEVQRVGPRRADGVGDDELRACQWVEMLQSVGDQV
ncbi:MAG: hypothetical protein Q9211_007016 [Gyalolechia sp. 1 TL-2023]